MAVATYTATTYNTTPKDLQTGVQVVGGRAQWTAAGTVGDIVFLAKIPHGATIIDFHEYHTSGQSTATVSFGFDRGIAAGGAGNASVLIASGVLATENRMVYATNPGPVTISLSDLDPVRYAVLQAKAETGTFTITVSFGWSILYHKSGPETV